MSVGIPEMDGSEESGEGDDGPECSESFGELLEGIAAKGKLLHQGSKEQERGCGDEAQQGVRADVEVPPQRPEAGDDEDVGGDEQCSEAKAGRPLAVSAAGEGE